MLSDIDPHPVPQVLEVGSMVQFGNPVQHGVIRKDSYSNVEIAKIATVSMYCM